MKKTVFSWTFGIITLLVITGIRILAGYKEPPAWYWTFIIGIVPLQIGKFLYYVIFGANIDKIVYQDMDEEDNELKFTFQFNPFKMSRTEYGLASFDPVAYPELKDPRVLQQILYGQTTKKEVRQLTDNLYSREEQPTKTYKYNGKAYKIRFYPRPIIPGLPPLGMKI
ncbi:hypothetical protein GYB57_04645 [bacterium]|nr:hypothetical protein [bacterium]